MRKQIPRLIIKGGVLSPSELKKIAENAEQVGLKTISFGSRQDILFPDFSGDEERLKSYFKEFNLICGSDEVIADNIVSSYISTDIFPTTSWMTGDRYLYILEQIKHQPTLKINITEPKQRLVPLFMGHLNFIASEQEDYWYLYVRLPGWEQMGMYPALIYSWDIAKVSQAIEHILVEEPEDVETIFELLNDTIETDNRTVDKPLQVPFHPFPYYEGMNRTGIGEYWLGLYWRNNKYDLDFLRAMCDLCSELKIGRIGITPWKSFIIKGIAQASKLDWEKLLGRFGINVRHSMLELNWHMPVANEELLELKRYFVSWFDQNDISTYGLTFSICEKTKPYYYFTSIVVERNKVPDNLKEFELADTFNLLYAKNFDPNTREYLTFVQDVGQTVLPKLLLELSQMYFEQLGSDHDNETQDFNKEEVVSKEVFQCQDCLTVYDETYGDGSNGIAPGTSFHLLPEDYCCSVCDGVKENFKAKTITVYQKK